MKILERQSSLSDCLTSPMNEVLHLYGENHVDDMFQEMIGTESELRERIEKLKNKRLDENERERNERVYKTEANASVFSSHKGLFNAKLEDLEAFLVDFKNT
ncbi:hypothetical protein Dimus_016119 [Dionaea muscipula]